MPVCCYRCFNDELARDRIRQRGSRGKCDYCSSNSQVVPTEELTDLFEPILQYYEPWEFGIHCDELAQSLSGEELGFLLQQDWEIFNEDLLSPVGINRLIDDILECETSSSELWGTVDDELTSLGLHEDDAWSTFSEHLKRERRFFLSKEFDFINPDYISTIIEEIIVVIPVAATLFRCRFGGELREDQLFPWPPQKMGAPPPDPKASGGRANPPGISYLYVATKDMTAIAEKRPAVGSILTLATLTAVEDLSVVNLTGRHHLSSPLGVDTLPFRIHASRLLSAFAHELSRPVSVEDPPLEYLPSQFLCELFLSLGHDGLMYPSGYSDGHNIVLFKDGKISITNSELIRVTGASLDFEHY